MRIVQALALTFVALTTFVLPANAGQFMAVNPVDNLSIELKPTDVSTGGCTEYVMSDNGKVRSPSSGGYIIVFLEDPRDARCLQASAHCRSDCHEWIRGRNGPVRGPASRVVNPGAVAYKVYNRGGTARIFLPARPYGHIAACDTAVDGKFDSVALVQGNLASYRKKRCDECRAKGYLY